MQQKHTLCCQKQELMQQTIIPPTEASTITHIGSHDHARQSEPISARSRTRESMHVCTPDVHPPRLHPYSTRIARNNSKMLDKGTIQELQPKHHSRQRARRATHLPCGRHARQTNRQVMILEGNHPIGRLISKECVGSEFGLGMPNMSGTVETRSPTTRRTIGL